MPTSPQADPEKIRLDLDPKATEEEVDKFVYSLALAIAATARRIIQERREEEEPPTIQF